VEELGLEADPMLEDELGSEAEPMLEDTLGLEAGRPVSRRDGSNRGGTGG
jgi:hypothetical protein